ncbi:adp-ribosylation factor 1 [Anaeramoeba flamelloides]|uniref:Adp-ribosylation factor 1 n=1 Tax=Anaeramoeba flamelloides TaxID=1746091 RepID=A0ABQ8YG06_9EUKA|nr:adp-ribosylation factor 1 [Anaeramoeba flamelloides]
MTEILVCGQNQNGQLLTLDVDLHSNCTTPMAVTNLIIERIGEKDEILTISSGSTQTVLLTESGKLYIWGLACQQQERIKILLNRKKPKKKIKKKKQNKKITRDTLKFYKSNNFLIEIDKFENKKVEMVSCGSLCATLLVEGKIFNIDFLSRKSNNLKIEEILFPKNIEIFEIYSGANYTLAIDQYSQVWSWGVCSNGELGHGESVQSITKPKLIETLDYEKKKFLKIACGAQHWLTLTRNNELFACGKNKAGQLGLGSYGSALVPCQVELPQGIPKILLLSCGDEHSLLLDFNGSAWGCGKGFAIGKPSREKIPKFCKLVFPNEVIINNIFAGGGYGQSYSIFLTDLQDVYYTGGEKIFGIIEKEEKKQSKLVKNNEKEIKKDLDNKNENENENEKENDNEKEKEKEKETENENENENEKEEIEIIPNKIKIPKNYSISDIGCGWLHTAFICDNLTKNEQKNNILEKKKKMRKKKSNKNKKKFKLDPNLGYFSLLPTEQIYDVFHYFTPYCLGKIATCSKALYYLSSDNIYWKPTYLTNLGPPNKVSDGIIENKRYENIGWKKAYFERMKSRRSEPKKSQYLGTSFFNKIKTKFKKKHVRCLMLGLDASGNTTILYKLKLGKSVTVIPTIGFNVETIDHNNLALEIWDVCSGLRLRPLWSHYFEETEVIIWVVDCNDRSPDRLEEGYEWLMWVLGNEKLKNVPVLVYANKCDLPNILQRSKIIEFLHLKTLENPWFVQPCCALNGNGLSLGLDWIAKQFKYLL